MSAIVVDAAAKELLLSGGQVEVRDESGAVVCQVTMAKDKWPVPPPGYEIVGEPWPSDEEIERRMREGKRYTIEQVLERLRSLDNAG